MDVSLCDWCGAKMIILTLLGRESDAFGEERRMWCMSDILWQRGRPAGANRPVPERKEMRAIPVKSV